MNRRKLESALARLIAVITILLLPAQAVLSYESPVHIVNVDDVMRGFDGSTYGPDGTITRPWTFCDITPASLPCPVGTPPQQDKDGTWLYPVDTEFGFYTVNFL